MPTACYMAYSISPATPMERKLHHEKEIAQRQLTGLEKEWQKWLADDQARQGKQKEANEKRKATRLRNKQKTAS